MRRHSTVVIVAVLLNSLAITLGQNSASVRLILVSPPIVSEADVTVEVCVDILGTVNATATLTLTTVDDTAKAGSDYTPLEVDITITEITQCYNVTILDDDIVEVAESFSVELINVVGVSVLTGDITVTIIPNIENIDTITVAFEQSSYSVSEGAEFLEVCIVIEEGGVDAGKTPGVEVGVSFIADTATADLDFDNMRLEFLFPNGSMPGDSVCETLVIEDDDVIEATEQFRASLESAEAVTVSEVNGAVPVNINDNDGVTLVLEPTATQYLQEANPGDPTDAVEVCIMVVVENGLFLERSVTVSLGLSGETADYDDFELSSNGTVVLTLEQPVQCINVTVMNDDVRESNETALLVLVPEEGADQIAEGNFSTIIIIDDGDVNCPALENPANGEVMFSNRSEGSVAMYTCDSDYVLSGNGTRVCGTDGSWSGEQPQCIPPVDCGPPPPASNMGSVDFTTTTVGSLAQYTCQEDAMLVGMSVLECLPSDMWSGTAPRCIDDGFIRCPDLENPENGQVMSDGVTAVYTCQEGYRLEGESQRECDGESGEWLGEEPSCSGDIQTLASFSLILIGLATYFRITVLL